MSNPFTYANKVRKKFKDPYWVAKNKYITYYEQLPIDEKVKPVSYTHLTLPTNSLV